MAGANHYIFDVLRIVRVALEFDRSSRINIDGVAAGAAPVIERLFRFEANLGVAISDGSIRVTAGIIVKLHVGIGIVLGALGVTEHLGVRLQVIIVVELDLAGAKGALRYPTLEELLFAALRHELVDERDRVEILDRLK